MKRIALVTGTSSGIGLHSAVQLAKAGFTVVATMRDPAKATALKREGIEMDVRQLDVQDDRSVSDCLAGVIGTYGGIDVLVNNAGSGFLGTHEQTTMTELRDVMEVNFFGVWRVTQAVLPRMRVAGSGRIITVTSVGGLLGQPFNDAYCAAKFAVEGFMESLAPVISRLGIHLSLIEPGPVNTEFVNSVRAKAGSRPAPDDAYSKMREAYLAGTGQAFATIGQTPADVATVIVEAATAEKPHFRYPTSEIVRGLVSRKFVDPCGDSVVALSGARLP